MTEKTLAQIAIDSPFCEILKESEELDRLIYVLAKKTILNRALLNYRERQKFKANEIILACWDLVEAYEFKNNFKSCQKFSQN